MDFTDQITKSNALCSKALSNLYFENFHNLRSIRIHYYEFT